MLSLGSSSGWAEMGEMGPVRQWPVLVTFSAVLTLSMRVPHVCASLWLASDFLASCGSRCHTHPHTQPDAPRLRLLRVGFYALFVL